MSRIRTGGSRSPRELVSKTETTPSRRRKLASPSRKIAAVGKALCVSASDDDCYAVCLTLTYAKDHDFAPEHISRFFDRLRSKLKRQGKLLRYLWVLEKAGRLHYHLVIWLPRGLRLQHAELDRWWPWGTSWIEACQSPHMWIKYLRKYEDKALLPVGARMFGYGGLDEAGKRTVALACLPQWLKAKLPADVWPTRIAGGWLDPSTGEIHTSPYRWTPKGFQLREQPQQGESVTEED